MGKTLRSDEQNFADFIGGKWIQVISSSALFILGVWMVLSPSPPERASYEKVTVALFKELWGMPFGLILLGITIPFLVYTFYKIYTLNQYAWVKFSNGYHLFEKQKRMIGLASMSDGVDLIVFHPAKQKVLAFKNYTNKALNKYHKVSVAKDFDNSNVYWCANEEGYTLIYNGENLEDKTTEWRGDDLIVKSTSKHLSLLLKDYKNSKDNKVRKATRL